MIPPACLPAVAAYERRFDPSTTNKDDLRRLLTYSRRFVQTITLRQCPTHVDLNMIFESMVK